MVHSGLTEFADLADVYGFFYYIDFIRIKLQQVGVDQYRKIDSNLLE